MRIIKGFKEGGFKGWKNLITIGSFDGIHKGHEAIIKKLVELATKNGGKSVVITFDPLPKEFFGEGKFKLITTFNEKLEILQEYGIDGVCVIPFTDEFSMVEPDEFLEIIWDYFQPCCIVVGKSHHFGRDGRGGLNLLKDFSAEKGIELLKVREVKEDNTTISSSGIRDYIIQGDIKKANRMLGRGYFFSAKVDRGKGVGRVLSYPTANLRIVSLKKVLPKQGVYAAEVLFKREKYGAMLYLGKRPTFSDGFHSTCEVHIMGYKGNLYGKKLTVKILDRIREERRFCSVQNLKKQIMGDEKIARKIIKCSA